jgi:hypothetical protein
MEYRYDEKGGLQLYLKSWIWNESALTEICVCGRPHLHGLAGGDGGGSRAPHCRYTPSARGYVLVPQEGPAPEEVVRAFRRKDPRDRVRARR